MTKTEGNHMDWLDSEVTRLTAELDRMVKSREGRVPTARDPRKDPKLGDVLLAHGHERTVYCEYLDGSIGWATESPIWSGRATLKQWRKWALEAEILMKA